MQKIFTLIIVLFTHVCFLNAQIDSVIVYDTTNTSLLFTSGPSLGDPLQDFQSTIGFDENNTYYIGSEGGGLCVFDGLDWSQITKDNTGDQLLSDFINAVFNDSKGNIWIGINGTNGIIKKTGANYTIFTNANTGGKFPNGNQVLCITEDNSGNIWAGTISGVAMYDGSNWTKYNSTNSNVPHNEVKAIACNKLNGDIWIGTQAGAAHWNGTTWTAYTSADGLSGDNITSVGVDDTGAIWFGTQIQGISIFDGISNWDTLVNPVIPSVIINCITFDAQGIPWIGTTNGLAFYDGSSYYRIKVASHGIPSNTIRAISIDNNGNACIATSEGLAIYKRGGIVYNVHMDANNICIGSGDSLGSITATPYYGTPPFTYLWDDGMAQTTQTAVNLSPGLYGVGIMDSGGKLAADTITLYKGSSQLVVSIAIMDSPTFVGSDGSLDLTVTGGDSPYTYDWSNGSTVEDPTNLSKGSYAVMVTDKYGCTDADTIELVTGIPYFNNGVDQFFVYPNPGFSGTSIFVKVSLVNSFTIDLYDMHGRLIKTIHGEKGSKKVSTIDLAIDNIQSGIYYITLKTGTAVTTKKVVILK